MPRKYRVHPAIGIARVGDSDDEFFIGPEAPGVPAVLEKPGDSSGGPGKYKDTQGRIKRQGARFRIYEYTEDSAGVVTAVREITASDARIDWDVHLVNRKAAAPKFGGGGRRNAQTPESELVIDAGPQRIGGAGQAMTPLVGSFMGSMTVRLGDLLTDDAGRLIVLGGRGESQSLPGRQLVHFADNDGWCDDVSDGPVKATIRLNGTDAAVTADPAWLIVAPPDFAPPIENVITLYDIVYNMMATFDPALAISETTPVSFTRDVYPILRRVSHMEWVSAKAAPVHGEGRRHHFISPSALAVLAQSEADSAVARRRIFQALRDPQGGGGSMPKLPDDLDPTTPGVSLTPVQYRRMERWANGTFDADWPGAPPVPTVLDELPAAEQPHALDRAALQGCVGGGFFPGIEVGRLMVDEGTYDPQRPFRVKAELAPGALTARMAVPWQADFHDCSLEDGADWWPGQRPNQVRRGATQAEWMLRTWTRKDMVDHWSQLGFVVEKKTGTRIEYIEDERAPELPATDS
jgi:L-Lysine epsilon oxidase N-terminal/L-lysine epsilon oxidase C-terminal domain